MKKILFILLILPVISQAQIKYVLDNALTGTYATSKAGDQTAVVLNGTNHLVTKRNVYMDLNPYYSLKYSGIRNIDNEILIREDIGYKDTGMSIFVFHQYNHSLIRGISSDNLYGVGIGKRLHVKNHFYVGLSYCVLYEYRKYSLQPVDAILRHSFRTKFKVDYKSVQLLFEYYFQPSVNDIKDLNIFGSTSLVFFKDKPLSFVIQNVYNYMSTDNVRTIQNTTFGFKYKLKSKYEKN